MKRVYQSIIEEHFANVDQMAFMPGPRQVGKTTIASEICNEMGESLYLNWDYQDDREIILSGPEEIFGKVLSQHLQEEKKKPIVVFDEIHKFKDWKNYLKGYFDYSKQKINTLVTGSAKLDIFKKGGDSLMGRYFLYHVHPLSVAELLERPYHAQKTNEPKQINNELWEALYQFGGFPEPLLKQDKRFYTRWQQLRLQQLFEEDIRDLSAVSELAQMEVLAKIMQQQAGSQLSYHNLAKKIQVSDKTIKSWLSILAAFFFSFEIKPWSKNVTRSLIKEPKIYLWDWSVIDNKGARIENFIASHLLKAVHYWTDIGLGKYELYYLRDKDKREVDFLITENSEPWLLAEIKASAKEPLSKNLLHFQSQIQAKHVFQIAYDMPYVDKDCFTINKPVIVPAKTLLSQLV